MSRNRTCNPNVKYNINTTVTQSDRVASFRGAAQVRFLPVVFKGNILCIWRNQEGDSMYMEVSKKSYEESKHKHSKH